MTRIKTTITFEHRLEDSTIAEFKSRVLERIKAELAEFDRECIITLDDIPNEVITDFLKDAIPDVIEDSYRGYGRNSGVEIDDYFETISFDYCGEDVRDWVQDVAEQIIADMEEE